MTIDIFRLSQDLADYLLPAIPYLLKAIKIVGQEGAKSIGEEIGKKIPNAITALWSKIWGKAEKNKSLKYVIERAAEKPDDPETQDVLKEEFREMLQDKAFCDEVAVLFERALQESPTLRFIGVQRARKVAGKLTNIEIPLTNNHIEASGTQYIDEIVKGGEATNIRAKSDTKTKPGSRKKSSS